jgi:hypothetical protein
VVAPDGGKLDPMRTVPAILACLLVTPLALFACGGDSGSTFGGGGGPQGDAGALASDAQASDGPVFGGSSSSGGSGSSSGSSGGSTSSGGSSSSSSSGGTVHNCTGCFDGNGHCVDGTMDNLCGAAGATCQDCTTFTPAEACHGTQAAGGSCGPAGSGSSSGGGTHDAGSD